MKVPLSWLQDFIAGNSIDVVDVHQAFIHLGFEVEEVINVGYRLTGPIKIGRVLEIEELTEFKKPIRYCQVQVGPSQDNVNGIVCGAANFSVGDHVVVALPGAELPGGFKIGQRETYGKNSNGMICSLRELGIGEDHSGILVLERSFKVGDDATEVLNLHDHVFDLSVLPDRGYALSVRGLARELAMYFDREFTDPVSLVKSIEPPRSQAIFGDVSAGSDCSTLVLTEISDIDPNVETPWLMKRRILLAGMRSVNFPVDVTNYVMLETGQPLHAFDAQKINKGILIRYANKGEKLETLDHTIRELDSTDLVVADDKNALSLAGIMGGVDSEIDGSSTKIVLEAANFAAERIAESARRHVLSSEASRRFERGVDPNLPRKSSDLACHLFIKYANAKIVGRVAIEDTRSNREVVFNIEKFRTIAGYELPLERISKTLESIGCKIVDPSSMKVEIPSWRPDLLETNDLAEEILRVTGYDQIPLLMPAVKSGIGLSDEQRLVKLFKTYLAARGHSEILNYPFLADSESGIFSDEENRSLVRIANPLSDEEPFLRNSLLPGLLKAAQRNIGRGSAGVSIFEIGTIFRQYQAGKLAVQFPLTKQDISKIDKSIPEQQIWLGLLLVGTRFSQSPLDEHQSWQWQDAIRVVSDLFNQFGFEIKVKAARDKGFHPGRCAEFSIDDMKVGTAGEVHPDIAQKYGLNNRAAAAHINLSELLKEGIPKPNVKPLVNFPIAKEDLAVVVPRKVAAGEVLATVKNLNLPELEQVELFDIYQGDQLSVDEKSIALALRFRALNRTLKSEEISALKGIILSALEGDHQARLRD